MEEPHVWVGVAFDPHGEHIHAHYVVYSGEQKIRSLELTFDDIEEAITHTMHIVPLLERAVLARLN